MNYLFGSGLVAALTAGYSLLKGTKEAPLTWRAVIAWLSWGITLALAVGTAVDMSRDRRGIPVAADSPLAPKQAKKAKKLLKELQNSQKTAGH